jgi:hypothetical protein
MAFTKQDIDTIRQAKAQGKTKEQALAALALARRNTPTQVETKQSTPGLQERLATVGNDVGSTITQAVGGEGQFAGQSPLSRAVQATASGFSAVPRGALAVAPEPVRTGVEKASDFIGKGFSKLTGSIAKTPLFKELGEQEAAGQVDLSGIRENLSTASAGGEIAGTIAGTQGSVGALNRVAKVKPTLQPVADAMRALPAPKLSVPIPRVGELVTKYRTQLSDIDPKYETILKAQPDASKTMAYFDQAEKGAIDPSQPMATKLASDRAVEAFKSIDAGASEAGKLKSALLDQIENERIPGNIAGTSIDNVKSTIKDRYGIEIDKNGNISQAKGRMASVDAKSQKLISEYVTLLRQLGPSPTARQLDDFVDKTQRMLYKQSSPNLFEVADEPVIAFLKQQTGEVNGQLKTNVDAVLKEKGIDGSYADLNQEYADLLEINNSLNKRLGVEGDKGASLMKSLFSPQTGEPTRRLFQDIKDKTGIDLFEEATLAKFAMESVGDTRSKSLLQQIDSISGDVSKVNLMEPGSWINFIREKADLDGRELAEAIIAQANAEIQK